MAEGGGLLNRCTGENLYRGFESLPLRRFYEERERANCLARVGIAELNLLRKFYSLALVCESRSVVRVCPKGKARTARRGREKFPSGNLFVTESYPGSIIGREDPSAQKPKGFLYEENTWFMG